MVRFHRKRIGQTRMPPTSKRIVIIAPIHGKVTQDRKVSEPDVYWIVQKWLERHPEIKKRQKDIRVSRGQWTTAERLKTEVLRVTITAGDDIAGLGDPDEEPPYIDDM